MCPFFLKDILKLWGAVRSRDLICIILVCFKASILVLCNIFWSFLLHDKPFILSTTPLIFTGKWLLTHALIYLSGWSMVLFSLLRLTRSSTIPVADQSLERPIKWYFVVSLTYSFSYSVWYLKKVCLGLLHSRSLHRWTQIVWPYALVSAGILKKVNILSYMYCHECSHSHKDKIYWI